MSEHRTSLRHRTRLWATVALVVMAAVGLGLLSQQHLLHGGLLLLGGAALAPTSLLGRRARRQRRAQWATPH